MRITEAYGRVYPLLLGAAILLTAGLAVVIILTQVDDGVRILMLCLLGGLVLLTVLAVVLIRLEVVAYTDAMGNMLDSMLEGGKVPLVDGDRETVLSKSQAKLSRLYTAMEDMGRRADGEREVTQRLVSDIAHQVKTPIANMRMYTEIIRDRELAPEQRRQFVAAVGSQVDRLDFLTQALLKMSRLETGVLQINPVVHSLADTANQAVEQVQALAQEKGIGLTVAVGPELTALHDPKWTAEALFNLLENAVKYTPSGGSVSLRASALEIYTKIDVSDDGMGIPEQAHGAVFQRFHREPEVQHLPGVGIGLYLVREIVTRQRGYIRLRSTPGEGSCFSVFLPRG